MLIFAPVDANYLPNYPIPITEVELQTGRVKNLLNLGIAISQSL